MTEQELIDLRFERSIDEEYHYYYYHIADGLGLISNESDSLKEGEWYVEVFDTNPSIRFTTKQEVLDFLSIINIGLLNFNKNEKEDN
jgi:hypothetical protein